MTKLTNKKLLHVALCGILGSSLTACCGSGGFSASPVSAPPHLSCNAQDKLGDLSQLDATESVDGLVLMGSGGVLITVGQTCGVDAQGAQCSIDLERAQEGLGSNSMIIVQGDQIRVLPDTDVIKGFLGELDNREKIQIWLHVSGVVNECESITQVEGDSHWSVSYTTRTNNDGVIVDETVKLSVEYDGAITELNRTRVTYDTSGGGGDWGGSCATPGRTPPGELSFESSDSNENAQALGKLFAKHAAYEAASVDAFTHLRKELEFHGAPKYILDKIDVAANDEVRHAEQVGELASFYGAEVDHFSVDTGTLRDLKSIALDNMKEGCVGESWAALIGLHQAEHAHTSRIKTTMEKIAIDEVGHAALSWEIHDWLYAQLDDQAKALLDQEKINALAQLKDKVSHKEVERYQQAAGLPAPVVACALLDQLGQAIAA